MKRLASVLAALFMSCGHVLAAPNLLVQEGGVRIAGFSSAAGGADLNVLLPPRALLEQDGVNLNDFVWCTADKAPFPHWVVFAFPRAQWLTTLVFNTELNDEMAYPGIGARQVEVWAGVASADRLERIATFELEPNRNGQAVRIPPRQVRWLKFVITRNGGNDTWTELAAFAAYDDGARPDAFGEALSRDGKVDVYGIYFDFGSAVLRAESAAALDEIERFLGAGPDRRLVIEGHTDAIGATEANLALSRARAQAVVDALALRGIDAARLQAKGYGASQPVADNAQVAGRARNRRVSVRLAPG
jgi:outer membrane protein OmpA-like peptidoglycan-associated protein